MKIDRVTEEAKKVYDEIVEIRRDLHAHPEIGCREFRTSELVRKKLKEYGVDECLTPCETGVVAVIKGHKGEGRTVGLRCDMDALPVEEETGLPFSSENKGLMHACGHDMHTAMMLGNAKILCSMRDEFAGTVKLIFEPSEETQPGGARAIIKSGAVDDVDAFFGLHVYPTEGNVGQIALKKGAVTTSADEVHITVVGKGGHGSEPHKACDAILAGCQLNLLFQQIQARNVDPLDTCVFTINTFNGGVKVNVIADECKMIGAIRAYTPETRMLAAEKVHEICRGVEAISGCKVEEQVNLGYDACHNDEELVDLLVDTYIDNYGKDSVAILDAPMSFSEDYSFFATQTGKPSVLMFLYSGHAEGVCPSNLHMSDCTFDEKAMINGMQAMSGAAVAYLASK